MAALVQGLSMTMGVAAAAPAKQLAGASSKSTAPAAGNKVYLRSAFLGKREGLCHSPVSQKNDSSSASGIQARCQPGFVVRRVGGRPSWGARRVPRATMSPWAAWDCTPANPAFVNWRRSRSRFQPAPFLGLNWILAELMRELPRGMSLRCGQCWDVVENEDSWVLRFELPGFGAEDVKVQIEDDNILVIKAKQAAEEDEDRDQFRSRRASKFQTRLRLPDTVQVDAIKAEVKKGILSVTLPKVHVEETKPRVVNIQVNAASAGEQSTTESEAEAVDAEVVKPAEGPEVQQEQPESEGKGGSREAAQEPGREDK